MVNTEKVSEINAKQDKIVKQLYDLARLAKNLLVGKELNDFVKRNIGNIK